MARVDDVALTRRRQAALERLRTTTATELARRWRSLGSYAESDQRRWTSIARPIVTAGQNQAIDTQLAYLGARLGRPVRFDRATLLELAAVDLDEPFLALARILAGGGSFSDAVASGLARAEGLGESSVQWAARAANTAAESDERIVGWRRTLGRGSCEWCVTVSAQRYRTAESASFGHQRCSCGVDPIIGDRDPGRTLNDEFLASGEE